MLQTCFRPCQWRWGLLVHLLDWPLPINHDMRDSAYQTKYLLPCHSSPSSRNTRSMVQTLYIYIHQVHTTMELCCTWLYMVWWLTLCTCTLRPMVWPNVLSENRKTLNPIVHHHLSVYLSKLPQSGRIPSVSRHTHTSNVVWNILKLSHYMTITSGYHWIWR